MTVIMTGYLLKNLQINKASTRIEYTNFEYLSNIFIPLDKFCKNSPQGVPPDGILKIGIIFKLLQQGHQFSRYRINRKILF